MNDSIIFAQGFWFVFMLVTLITLIATANILAYGDKSKGWLWTLYIFAIVSFLGTTIALFARAPFIATTLFIIQISLIYSILAWTNSRSNLAQMPDRETFNLAIIMNSFAFASGVAMVFNLF